MDHPLLTGAQPLYQQVYQVLRSRLETGVWQRGQTLPAIPALMQEFQASRVTVREALQLLENEGLILRQRGIGTTVQAQPRSQRWVRIATTMEELLEIQRSVQPSVLNLSDHARLPDVPLPPGVTPATDYARMQRVHLHEGQPYCVIDLAVEAGLFKRHRKAFLKRPALLVIHEVEGLQVASARQDLSIRSADLAEARHLSVPPGSPVAEVRRILTNAKGVVIYAAVVVYPSHTVHLSIDLLAPRKPSGRRKKT